jgi:hypothetical protein
MARYPHVRRLDEIEASLVETGVVEEYILVEIFNDPEAARLRRLANPDLYPSFGPVTVENYPEYQARCWHQEEIEAALPPTLLRIKVDRNAGEG